MKLNEAVSIRLAELLHERNMTQYELYTRSGVAKSTVNNIINQTYPSVSLRILHEMCQGLGIGLNDFFQSPLFNDANIDPLNCLLFSPSNRQFFLFYDKP